MKLEFPRQIFEKYLHVKFHEYLFSGSGRTDVTKLFAILRTHPKSIILCCFGNKFCVAISHFWSGSYSISLLAFTKRERDYRLVRSVLNSWIVYRVIASNSGVSLWNSPRRIVMWNKKSRTCGCTWNGVVQSQTFSADTPVTIGSRVRQ